MTDFRGWEFRNLVEFVRASTERLPRSVLERWATEANDFLVSERRREIERGVPKYEYKVYKIQGSTNTPEIKAALRRSMEIPEVR